jgi:hypothetical protein
MVKHGELCCVVVGVQVLFQQQGRLRCDPFEWVYDGLAPLMLPQVRRHSSQHNSQHTLLCIGTSSSLLSLGSELQSSTCMQLHTGFQ